MRGGDVIGNLETIAEEIMEKTAFFHNGVQEDGQSHVQNGVARTNCIDCLDRTNAAQFVIGKRAFGHQLQALGVIPSVDMEYDSDAINILTHMFHHHGDTIAVQYGGSHLVNTMATYRKINHWQSQSRDMVESFKRYYHNSFLDSQRQEAYNLFLGNYVWAQGQPMLWDLATDYYLHHTDPKAWLDRSRRSYIDWYHPEYLEKRVLPPPTSPIQRLRRDHGVADYDDYWLEYYRPLAISSFLKIYAYRINSTNRYLPDRPLRDGKFDFSPFVPRVDPNRPVQDSPEKKPARKGVTIIDPNSGDNLDPQAHRQIAPSRYRNAVPESNGILRDPAVFPRSPTTPASYHTRTHSDQSDMRDKAADKSLMTQWTLNQFYTNSLNPSVTDVEAQEYDRYISHPLSLPLVTSNQEPQYHPDPAFASPRPDGQEENPHLDLLDYIHSGLGQYDGEGTAPWDVTEEDVADFRNFLDVGNREDALTVLEEDGGKKRYKAYRQWLIKGKSLFKQNKVDPEFKIDGIGSI